MPTYLVTDTVSKTEIMVEAMRPATAIAAVVDNRFTVSESLSAAEGIRLAHKGVPFLDIAAEADAETDAEVELETEVDDAQGDVIAFDADGRPVDGSYDGELVEAGPYDADVADDQIEQPEAETTDTALPKGSLAERMSAAIQG